MTPAQKELNRKAFLARLTPPKATPGFDAVEALDALERAGGNGVFRSGKLWAGDTRLPGNEVDWRDVDFSLVEWRFGKTLQMTKAGVHSVLKSRWNRC